MVEVGRNSCCSHPEALVVIAAIPLCQAETLQGMLQEELCMQQGADSCDNTWRSQGLADVEQFYDQDLFGFMPLRCACVMDCQDAICLMQEVGHVVL